MFVFFKEFLVLPFGMFYTVVVLMGKKLSQILFLSHRYSKEKFCLGHLKELKG